MEKLPPAGHSAVAIQDENGKWSIMSFEPVGSNKILGVDVPNIGVIFTELEDINLSDDKLSITSANYNYTNEKGSASGNISRYDNQVYIKGDFTKSFDKAAEYEKKPPSYFLTGQNCSWLAIETLQSSTSGDTYKALDKVLWSEYPGIGKVRNTLIPNFTPDRVSEIFNNNVNPFDGNSTRGTEVGGDLKSPFGGGSSRGGGAGRSSDSPSEGRSWISDRYKEGNNSSDGNSTRGTEVDGDLKSPFGGGSSRGGGAGRN